MERNGKQSRIGDENREIANDNAERAQLYTAEFELQNEIDRKTANFDKWRDQKREEIESAQEHKKLDLDRRQHREKDRLEERLKQTYGTAKETLKAEVAAIDRKLEAKGVRKVLRDVFGKTRTDKEARQDMQATLKSIEAREKEQRRILESRHKKNAGNRPAGRRPAGSVQSVVLKPGESSFRTGARPYSQTRNFRKQARLQMA